jgi:Zn-finger nucleic acid-binding protein
MNCPRCNVVLTLSNRDGVEVDYCPQCRGVWLDRGELEKVIDRANRYYGRRDDDDDDDDDDRRRHSGQTGDHRGHGYPQQPPPYPQQYAPQQYPPQQQHYRKKKSFWQELFD